MKSKFKRIFHILLIISFLGGCPGISDSIQLWAQSDQTKTNQVATEKNEENGGLFAVSTSLNQEQAVVHIASATPEKEPIVDPVKKEMSRAEQLAWTIGKALLPTLAVMGLGAAVVCPLAWVVVGAVLIGAATAGIVTFAYESRMNQFRAEGKKKSQDKILRDVTIAAAVEGAMAPFSLVSAGFVKTLGPLTVKSIATAAAKAGAVQFVGGTISNIAKGTVTNAWYNKYYNYDEEEKELKEELQRIKSKANPTEEDQLRLVEILKRLDALEDEKYTMRNFVADERKTLVSAAISGVLGGGATQIAGNQNWAKIASDKLFQSPKNAGLVAKAVVSNPFAFLSGSANALQQEKEIDQEIKRCRSLQASYEPGSSVHSYYEDKIKGLEKAKANIDLMKSGTDAMINNMAVQSAGLTVAVARARIWDLPHARRDAIDKKVKEKSPEWQNAEKIKASADALRAKAPARNNFSSAEEYRRAMAEHKSAVAALENNYKAAKVIAVNSEKEIAGKALRLQAAEEVDSNIQLQRKIDLAKSLGDEAYLKFKMEEIKKRGLVNGQELDDTEIRRQAVEEFKKEYESAAKKSASQLAKMEEKLTLAKNGKELKGKIVTDEQGKKFVVLENEDGVEQYRRAMTEPKVTWYNKFFQKDPAQRELKEIENAYRIANAAGAMVKPSEYRASYVDMKVNELKAQGYTNEQVNAHISSIIKEADVAMLNTFGGSWSSVTQAETLAAGLTRAKYNNGEPPDFAAIYKAFQSTAQTKIIAEFQKELSNQAKTFALNPVKEKVTGGKNDTFVQKYANTVLDKTFEEAVTKTTNAKVNSAFETLANTTTSTVKEAVTNATYDYKKNTTGQ